MSLKSQITEHMKDAMRAKDKERLGVIRLILAAIKQLEVDNRVELEDVDVLAVLDKMVKQRRESIRQYSAAGRTDLADQEAFEIGILQSYLPQPLTDDEIQTLVMAVIAQTGAASVKDMGSVMGVIKPQVQGRADMGKVSALIKSSLGG